MKRNILLAVTALMIALAMTACSPNANNQGPIIIGPSGNTNRPMSSSDAAKAFADNFSFGAALANAAPSSSPAIVDFTTKPYSYTDAEGNQWRVNDGTLEYTFPGAAAESSVSLLSNGSMTSYTVKTIYLNHCSSFTVYHEFGHYIANELGLHDEVVDYLYDQEWHFNYTLREYMRPYSGTNPREFFADCFADYVTSITQRERLENLAPLTYWVLENMVFGDATLEDFWKIAVNYDGNDLVVVTVVFKLLGRLLL